MFDRPPRNRSDARPAPAEAADACGDDRVRQDDVALLSDLDPDLPITEAELDAILRLLGEDLARLLAR
jgi:hypothetical protein